MKTEGHAMNPIPQMILAQLGGNRFLAMTGARNLTGGENYLNMAVPNARHNGKRILAIWVILEPSDTYTVRAVRFGNTAKGESFMHIAAEENDVYCDNLRETFTRFGDKPVTLTNSQMIEGRFARWANARAKHRKIVETLSSGGIVQIATHTRYTNYTKPEHADAFQAGRNGLYVRRGSKHWDCIDYAAIRFWRKG